ncbi:MAG: SMP-30/gluconolactonase/LRE family protein [Deltaproteobacteria bacterium]|nr:SMP-30/gluconolactonase/LRE family protein [Deltaproteobacteria bacterium]
MDLEAKVLIDGLKFPETPRWHDGKLWFSDMVARKVMMVDLDGRTETIVEVPNSPGGIGWLPDGKLLVVSMRDRRLLRLDPGGLVEVADLSKLADFSLDDMVVDAQGRAYVGHFGYDALAGKPFALATLIMVTPDGEISTAADDMAFPNGCVMTPDNKTLIVAESIGRKLTAFDMAPDGSLSNRRLWAGLEQMPDGICLDAEGAIWVSTPAGEEVIRVHEGGKVSQRIKTKPQAYACMLGGEDRRILFLCTSTTEAFRGAVPGAIQTIRVDVPGAGRP